MTANFAKIDAPCADFVLSFIVLTLNMAPPSDMPNISSMKLSELKKELNLYCIDSSGFCEKSDFTSALQNARDTLPRPSTIYREVEQPPPPEEKKEKRSSKSSKKSSSSSSRRTSSSNGSNTTPTPAVSTPIVQQQTTVAPQPPPTQQQTNNTTSTTNNAADAKKSLARRSPVTALQQLREHPSERLLGERNNTFLPGSAFSFALRGSIREDDSAIISIPDGVCLKISSASVDRKEMETYLIQKGTIGISLKLSSEENPQLMPIWTFDKDKSTSYTVSNLGIEVCGPRKIRLLAFMEMGFRSGASVDLFLFGSVCLDRDKF